MVTVTQTLRVASITIPNSTQEGMMPPRRRTSAREPISSIDNSLTEGRAEVERGTTRCDWIRSSTQYECATLLLKGAPPIPISVYSATATSGSDCKSRLLFRFQSGENQFRFSAVCEGFGSPPQKD